MAMRLGFADAVEYKGGKAHITYTTAQQEDGFRLQAQQPLITYPSPTHGLQRHLSRSQETPDDVLSSLPPSSSSLAETGNVPVLLATPSFAQWINPDGQFLEQWMNRLYPIPTTSASPGPIHAILAVIDRIPDARLPTNSDGVMSESEGLTVTIAQAKNIKAKAAAPRRARTMGTEEAALVFSIETSIPGISDQTRRAVHEVGLRLANTIFVNGNDNTLLGTRWVYDSSANKYVLDRSLQTSCGLPLYPVGQRRTVISSMGNILRQVAKHADGSSNEPMPASSELEKELPRYIAENNIAEQRVSVWALVEKPGTDVVLSGTSTQDRLVQSIQAGGKLHRVMSGGGGWGKKQGLLSLDPEINFLEAKEYGELSVLDHLFPGDGKNPVQEPLPFEQPTMAMDDLSSLSQVASPGDYVQFFVSVEPGQTHSRRRALSELPQGSVSYHFGMVSDADMPATEATEHIDLIAVPRYFGALSEKAITYIQPKIEANSKGGVLGTSTKCDIPGSRIEMTLA
ncbi:hypothetical protein CNMCM8980_009937 [Aspergillus fumigatiaffinis]|uniref:V-type ATPase n=1 Tax=Aspergillus fumigatiaffinis TaxID=340414 RepID=A0A8H4MC77_9EURO|nr:hypothetical protein CNMCM5878_005261 [Aspergillus fumigatiaffinis]KAF4232902.1 hypothetical protein CNMCM6457_004690 [Aspergillus fumigatiaffinis]KAF4240336.1 hypothetical protein CNMCM6805_005128 [Aspergillus fumigatiaffinis]KAF4244771.1 hypothetical protein CNMCM8980_009937 [Aspergillus fumigatiaffinis]